MIVHCYKLRFYQSIINANLTFYPEQYSGGYWQIYKSAKIYIGCVEMELGWYPNSSSYLDDSLSLNFFIFTVEVIMSSL